MSKAEYIKNNESVVSISKPDLLMISLTRFFKDKEKMDIMLPIIEGKSPISLRILDWFVTNYSKKNNINYRINGEQFIVHLNYKSQLKAYSKKTFDPFCRRERINFEYDDKNNNVITTVGQLNFFRWALESNVIDYVDKNLDNIEEDMNSCIRNNYGKKKKQPEQKEIKNIVSKTRRKRQSLSVSATKSINRHNVQITVSFE
tara:strand:+ start:161 stop:766 length:606 start_codon:yes stop_codon:yes gene_type:complete